MTSSAERGTQLQELLNRIGTDRSPYVETGRKFDRIVVDGRVTFFVARSTILNRCEDGDIFGAKSKLAPNPRWYFGNIENAAKWDWSGPRPVPVSDTTVLAAKSYGEFVHYIRIPR